jgi:hypothetical protein
MCTPCSVWDQTLATLNPTDPTASETRVFAHSHRTQYPQSRSYARPRHPTPLGTDSLPCHHLRTVRKHRAILPLRPPQPHHTALYSAMERPHYSAQAVSERSQPLDVVKQAPPPGRHSPVVLHSPPAARPPTPRGSSMLYIQRHVTTGSTPRLPHQRHGHHSSDPFVQQYQYARPITHGTPPGIAYTHHVTSRAEPVPIGNRDIIVSPAEERSSNSPTAGAASKLFLSMKRTLSLKKAQPVRLLSSKIHPPVVNCSL